MSLDFAHSYVHTASVGNFSICKEFQDKIGDLIQDLYEKGAINGFQLFIIENKQQEIEEFLPQNLTKEITNSKFPYIFIRIQLNEESILNIDKLMNENDSVRID